MNYYELLEISPSASVEVIRNAYKTLAKKYHPDTYKGDTAFAEEKMKLLNEAISVLEDEGKRNEYNKINGITQSGAYSEYGRADMLNVDENGESIFFAYEAEGSGMPEGDASYMDIIDNFIKNSEPDKKFKKKAEKELRDTQPEDDSAFENHPIDADMDDYAEYGQAGDGYEREAEEADLDLDPGPDGFSGEAAKAAAAKEKFDGTKIYYIVVASMITVIILLAAMILRSVDLENIGQLFSAASNKNKEETPDSAVQTDPSDPTGQTPSDTAEPDTSHDIVFSTEATVEIETEETTTAETTEPTEPETPATTKEPATTPATTSPPTQPATRPPATEPPATEPPATEPPATTEPPTTPPLSPPTEPATKRPVPTLPPATEPPETLPPTEPPATEPPAATTPPETADTMPPVTPPPATAEPPTSPPETEAPPSTEAPTVEPTLAPLAPDDLPADEEI
ncbi:MAG: DnaJ domain-containing protein [Oscillospiraceae bacterium]|nr:DnaJ domain-containing protein [Oscillospiraceae bacterium]